MQPALIFETRFVICHSLFLKKVKHTLFGEPITFYLTKALLARITFPRITCNVITFPNIQIFYLPFISQTIPKILPNI